MSDSEDANLDEAIFSDENFSFKVTQQSTGQVAGGQKQVSTGTMTIICAQNEENLYRNAAVGMTTTVNSVAIQSEKIIRDDLAEDEYYDEDDPNKYKVDQGFEFVGVDKFLSRVSERMMRALETNIAADLFKSYDIHWDDTNEETELVYKLKTEYDFAEANNATAKSIQQLKESEKKNGGGKDFDDDFNDGFNKNQSPEKKKGLENLEENQYAVTAISWSSNGASLAVAYGKTNHISWCEHQSILNIWSIFRRDFDSNKANITIEVPNCLSSIAFHPSNPQILAAGTVNGEIFIYNLNSEDSTQETNNLICKSESDEYFHREPIHKLLWTINESVNSLNKETSLVTVSSDGKILVWNNPLKNLRFPILGHIFAKVKDRQLVMMSGSSLALIPDTLGMEENHFMVGTEGGLVQKVSVSKHKDKDIRDLLTGNPQVNWSEEAMSFLSNISDQKVTQKVKDHVDSYMLMRPAPRQVFANHIFSSKPPLHMLYPPLTGRQSMQYDKHYGPVLGVSTSPFNKRLFLTCSTDGCVRLYDVQDKRPVAQFEPSFGEYLNCVEWSLFRPAVFACVSSTGTLYIYDLVLSKQKPVETIQLDDSLSLKESLREAATIMFNPRQRDFVAVGYFDKTVRVYRLSGSLSNMTIDDNNVLKKFLEERKLEEKN